MCRDTRTAAQVQNNDDMWGMGDALIAAQKSDSGRSKEPEWVVRQRALYGVGESLVESGK
jgi:hypothetical protein